MNSYPRLIPYGAVNTLTRLLACVLLGLTAVVPAAASSDGTGLVQERRCYGCHEMKQNLLGPSYLAIAARHAARKDVMVEVLAEKIIVGGAGNWGVVPMVPNEQVSLEEARTIARWILDLDPDAGGR